MKKGYFFIVDAMVAIGALAIGMVLIFSMSEYRPSTTQSYTVSEDVLNILSYNRIKQINNYYAGPNSVLTRNGNITDISKPLIEQSAEFYYRYDSLGCDFCKDLIGSFLGNITQKLIPENYNYVVIINNETVFNHSSDPISDAIFVTPARAIVHGIYNQTDLYGPYLVEVISWG